MDMKFVTVLSGLIVGAVTAGAQGTLTPPGAPGPVFKTLDQIESRTPISSLPYRIQNPGSYYLTQNLTNTVAGGDGITIESSQVALDLNGYTLFGGVPGGTDSSRTFANAGNTGIFISGDVQSIRIENGSVTGWLYNGIYALKADDSIFQNLMVSWNGSNGLVADFNCIISYCTAYTNGLDGLDVDDGSVISYCTARYNGDNGIKTSEGCTVVDCSSFANKVDGIDVGAGSTIRSCTSTDNGLYGFDLAMGGQAVGCTAYDNQGNGFDIASACVVRDCISSINRGHGFRMYANAYVTHCKAHENDLDGILIASSDVHVTDNSVTDNDQCGISATSTGSFIARNTLAGNATNINIIAGNAYGPIVDVSAIGDVSAVPNADHPQANLIY